MFPPFVFLEQSYLHLFYLQEKCAEYWPSPNSKTQVQYDDITVTFDSKVDAGGYVITKLYISHGKVGFSVFFFILKLDYYLNA